MKCLIASVLCLLASSASGQLLTPGLCRNVQHNVHTQFDISAYVGTWFEIQRYETRQERNADCVNSTFSTNPDGTFTVVNRQVILEPRSVSNETGIGRNSQPQVLPAPATLTISYNRTGTPQHLDYNILDTDYVNYAIVYACHDYDTENKYEYAWVLSRQRNFTNATVSSLVAEILSSSHITQSSLRRTEQNETLCDSGSVAITASIFTIVGAAILLQIFKQ